MEIQGSSIAPLLYRASELIRSLLEKMKNNMKAALSLITGAFSFSFLIGFFGWYVDDGVFALIGFAMMAGIIWAWIADASRE